MFSIRANISHKTRHDHESTNTILKQTGKKRNRSLGAISPFAAIFK